MHLRRYQTLDVEPMDDSNDNSNHTWLQEGLDSMQLKRSEMNELIMDYLVHEGFKEAAERFKEEAGIELSNFGYSDACNSGMNLNKPSQIMSHRNESTKVATSNIIKNDMNSTTSPSSSSSNSNNNSSLFVLETGRVSDGLIRNGHKIDDQLPSTNPGNNNTANWLTRIETAGMMDKRIQVRHHIEEGNILEAQSFINLYYPELLDNHRGLYFKLQQQHLIELIRQQKINDVLSYVHEQLSVDELGDLTEMERTLALLAYENPDKSPYANLLQISHRLQLASEINDIILQDTTGSVEPYKPRLVTLLKLLFWTQNELERKKIQFPKMTDLVSGTIVDSRY